MNTNTQIIEFMKNNPLLRDRKKNSYKNVELKKQKWMELSIRLNIPVNVLQQKWKHLRDSYNRNKRFYENYPADAAEKFLKNRKYYESMSFLDNSNSANNSTCGKYEEIILPGNKESNNFHFETETQNEHTICMEKTRSSVSSLDKVTTEVLELIQICKARFSDSQPREEQSNENELFFKFIAQKAEKHLSSEFITEFQSEVLSLLNEKIEEQHE